MSIFKLVGLTVDKKFIKSVANTIGTDLAKYKVIRNRQFACSLMQVSRDGKMPVAMFDEESAIMSPAYPMFQVKDTNVLIPEYLMIYFSRPEFDREAAFHAVGGVRGSLQWDDFCNIKIPVPPIAEQRKIVEQYQTIERRIKNNEALIQKLEATAQALYHHTFVEGIDKENLPEGWRMGKLSSLIIRQSGGDWGLDKAEGNNINEVFCIRGTDIPKASVCNKDSIPTRFIKSINIETKILKEGEVVIEISGGTEKQSTGRCCLVTNKLLTYFKKPIICSNFCRVLETSPGLEHAIYASLKNSYAQGIFFRYENSSNNIHNLDFDSFANDMEIVIPPAVSLASFSQQYATILSYIHQLGHEIELLLKTKLFINSNICIK